MKRKYYAMLKYHVGSKKIIKQFESSQQRLSFILNNNIKTGVCFFNERSTNKTLEGSSYSFNTEKN